LRLRYTKTALRQIEAALSFIAVDSPQRADGFRRRILVATALVLDHPFIAQSTSRSDSRRVVLTPYPYVIFYRVAAGEIVLTRLRHAARKPLSEAKRS